LESRDRSIKRTPARSEASIDFARDQRQMAHEFAATVWQWLRNRQIERRKFRREHPIPPYTVDFCCVEERLVIEVDGEVHLTESAQRYDRDRDRFLNQLGYKVLRIPGYEVIREDGQALQKIRDFVREAIASR
jgi:very-short-patch-repair endonuclease